MHARNKFLMSMALATGLVLSAGAATAATIVSPWTQSPNGGISVVFSNDGLGIAGQQSVAGETTTTHAFDAGTGAFTDTFSFELPTGILGFTLSSNGFAPNSSIILTSVKFNGTVIDFTNVPNNQGGSSFQILTGPFNVVAGGPQVLEIIGTGGGQAVFTGTGTFETAVVPEPGAWALMILGFGGTGAMMRRRRTAVAAA